MIPNDSRTMRPGILKRATDLRQGISARTIPIIAICHLSWDWVWQRPQQFLSRLSKTHPLLFVQTHCSDTEESFVRLRQASGYSNITIMEIHLPAGRWDDGGFIDSERRGVLQDALVADLEGAFDRSILWINDPMAVDAYAGHLGETMVVYDCMDELSQFVGAHPEMLERERKLTLLADVIFCGGRKMRDKRLPENGNTHFYGTGVDCLHFGKVMDPLLPVHPSIAGIPGPVLGYFGVIDERIDYELLEKLADADRNWSIVMVGPITKVDPSKLPQRPNIHWLGAQPYGELPALTKGMDVCLMPFALNEATEYINPTKALEYMAAGKIVVATGLDEVKSNFSAAALIADHHDEFIEFCWQSARSPSRTLMKKGIKLAAANTWEAIVSKMDGHIQDVITSRLPSRAAPALGVQFPNLTETPGAYV
jgi:glycosyltransferase involved in cell wall biosynthesis